MFVTFWVISVTDKVQGSPDMVPNMVPDMVTVDIISILVPVEPNKGQNSDNLDYFKSALGYFSYFLFNFPSIWQLNHTLYFEQFYLLSFAFNKTLNRWHLFFWVITQVSMIHIYESWEIIKPDIKPFNRYIIINTDKNQSN